MVTNQVHAILLNSNGTNCYIPFEVELRWDAADPLSVHLVCKLVEGDVDWVVGRDLLHRGATSLVRVGEGDVGFRREDRPRDTGGVDEATEVAEVYGGELAR